MKRIVGVMCVMGVVVLLAGCATQTPHTKGGQLKDTLGAEKIDRRYIESIGIGAADPNLESQTQRRATSREAAIVAAQYQLATMIKGVHIEGGVTIEKAMQTDSVISATVDAEIKGAEIIKTEWMKDDGCVVTLRIDLQGLARRVGLKLQ
ncbi:hypothetical protein AUJ66_07535 [Candidatus Desantisbacteria bacterium CG1_02_38_46]|uniref:LPP20 lipoprotein n=2 Tax=unclassified Candidatus Desantisiibacteriota TaxID=3106372 RepID=A0A1J4SBI7_9BACT|nr:MAG: hypothetical protein AUJ66_07535 [Candidatus Desantisbacteria bacterium CG1_02_38_46]PIU52202.1 MAG: hypothetical protein COS91_00420 [Candidatus Desantisbacteria bacterium CG07_land_8_20_14_0_80_39_15]